MWVRGLAEAFKLCDVSMAGNVITKGKGNFFPKYQCKTKTVLQELEVAYTTKVNRDAPNKRVFC